MKAWCINLDRRPDRLAYITAEFARVGLPFERIAAVDGQDPAVAAAAARVAPTARGPRMSASTYACFQSHRSAWTRLIGSGAPYAMIFEDDLLLAPGIADYASDAWVPPDADIVRLETFGIRTHLAAGPGRPAGSRRLHRLRAYHHGGGGYVISARAARMLHGETEAVSDPVDWTMFHEASPFFARLTTYQMLPAPVIQGDRAARGKAPAAGAAWIASSIPDRFAAGVDAPGQGRETPLGRIGRRLTAEIGGRLRGTRYVFVPHG